MKPTLSFILGLAEFILVVALEVWAAK